MKIKIQFSFAALLALLAAGCASHKNRIVFTDDGSMPRVTTNFITPRTVKGLDKSDLAKIEVQIFGALLTRHFWDDGNYTAIFLQADDAEVTALQQMFPDRVPPIKAAHHANLRPNRTPLDKDTGKPAVILSVDVSEPDSDGAVPVIGKWYAGGAVTGFYSFVLKKNGDDWEIQTTQ